MKKITQQKGQIIIIILLILVVVLTVGLSIATRTVTDIKISQQTELSQRAFNAAEAGIESVLSGQAATGVYVPIGTGANPSSYNVSVQTVGGSNAAFVFPNAVLKDNTQQIWFIGHKADNTFDFEDPNNFNDNLLWIYWGNPGQPVNNTSDSPITPALEVSIIYKDATGFKIAKGVYDPSTRTASNNFIDGIDTAGGYTSSQIQFRKQIDLEQEPYKMTGIDTGATTLYALRMRLLYNDTAQLLGAQPGESTATFPVQGKLISSTGNAGDVYRKVEVYESYPVMPPIFDYVLFNGSGTLSK